MLRRIILTFSSMILVLAAFAANASEEKPVAALPQTVVAGAPALAPALKPAEPSLEQRVADLEALSNSSAVCGISSKVGVNPGDNAWVLVSAALVLMMTAPGLALFYGGLVRKKNVLSTMMHSMFLMALVSIMWVVYGYSMAFGEGNAYFGDLRHFMLNGVSPEKPNLAYAPTIPHQTFMLYQMMFAIITPALISGAYAERIKFSTMVVFTILWSTIVYFPLAHMLWGKGGLFNWAGGGRIPVLDFAGGTVVHISSGVTALVCALVLGKRVGYPQQPMMPHNLVLSLTGAGLLWVGWFGFNAGSALCAGSLANSAFAATHFAAAAAGLSWAGAEWVTKGRPSALGAASGMVAGLATVTQASGFVTIPSALLIGFIAGIVCFLAVSKVKNLFGYDDSLDAFGVHGIGGIMGALLTGLLASPLVNKALLDTYQVNGKAVSLEGGSSQFVNQATAVIFAIVLAGGVSFILLKVLDLTMGLRPTKDEELQGMDITQHGEEAYA
ncbi:MAG TPA: ammonium transporter [Planctomycetota bacterium]|jgi:Amt family ammonium transporter